MALATFLFKVSFNPPVNPLQVGCYTQTPANRPQPSSLPGNLPTDLQLERPICFFLPMAGGSRGEEESGDVGSDRPGLDHLLSNLGKII